MKIILNSKLKCLSYPVGPNLLRNLSTIKEMAKSLKRVVDTENDKVNLICTGSSGAILAGLIFTFSGIKKGQIFHVKKEGEESNHDNNDSARMLDDGINIFVDDFINSGNSYFRCEKLFPIHGIIVTGKIYNYYEIYRHLHVSKTHNFVICRHFGEFKRSKWINNNLETSSAMKESGKSSRRKV